MRVNMYKLITKTVPEAIIPKDSLPSMSRNIYLYIWLIYMLHAGINIQYMDPMGIQVPAVRFVYQGMRDLNEHQMRMTPFTLDFRVGFPVEGRSKNM